MSSTIDLDRIEELRAEWEDRNFPAKAKTPNEASLINAVAGVSEETGELAHAVLKMQQGIRGTAHEHELAAMDAVGDICMYLMGVCRHLPRSFAECIECAWGEISQRDWLADPEKGGRTDQPDKKTCDRKKSDMTPCVITDGLSARANDGACVGCGLKIKVQKA